jgi:hypothetical protein
MDGTGNNLTNVLMGSAGVDLVRRGPVAYSDGVSSLARASGPNARDVSNAVMAQSASTPNTRNLSDMVWQWGQFIDHDLDLTPLGSETLTISTQASDPIFHGSPIQFSRSAFRGTSGTGPGNPRQQQNVITSFLDASMVYGSSNARADALRAHSGGRLLSQSSPTGEMLPFNTMGLPNGTAPGGDPTRAYVSGDVRTNEQTGLIAIHTLFLREHNRLADQLSASNPSWDDERVFQTARKIVGAEIQKITYEDWLPTLLGPGRLSAYAGYNPNVDAGVSTEFSTAAFRIGHTMLGSSLARVDNNGAPIAQGPLSLRTSFFDPDSLEAGGGIGPLLKGMTVQRAQEIDVQIVDDVRNFLFGPFGPPGATGFDLAALNIQRGRDHGIADYNTLRQTFGFSAALTFADISSDPAVQAALASVYASVNDIDPWVGMLAEDHLLGGSVGPLMTAIIVDQFERTRDGDRFFYLNDPDLADYRSFIDRITLGDLLRFNTEMSSFQDNVFLVPAPSAILLVGALSMLAGRRRRA